MTVNAVTVARDYELLNLVWPRVGAAEESTPAAALPFLGLGRRISVAARDRAAVVVGDEKRDFLLFHGLSRLRPHVFWLPASRLDSDVFVGWVADAAHRAAQEA